MDLSHLNAPQRQAVCHGDEPLLVLAGAGTGKTRVITHRIAHLLAVRRVPASAILALTFTNKAAREMAARTGALTGIPPLQLDLGTFHRMGGRLLRQYATELGLTANFVIYDHDDALQLIRRCLVELQLDPQAVPPQAVRQQLDRWKNAGLTPEAVPSVDLNPLERTSLEVYRRYQAHCIGADAADFGDLLLHPVTLLRQHPEIRAQLQARWRFILVDEYQDTNPVQAQLLKLLVTTEHGMTAVGDDDQSIYRWRGADVGNILHFERDFPAATLIRLEENYRSTRTILAAANAVIGRNVGRRGKTLFCQGEAGARLSLRIYANERDEGDALAAAMSASLAAGQSPEDIAVLYRVNAQSRPLEEALRRRRIPYRIVGGVRFYDRKEIKDALAYLRLLVNPRSTLDFLRALQAPPRGIGKTSVNRLLDYAAASGLNLLDAARAASTPGSDAGLTTRAQRPLAAFVAQQAAGQAALREAAPLSQILGQQLETAGYLLHLRQEEGSRAQERLDNLEQLAASLDEYVNLTTDPSLAGFLEDVALATDIDGQAETGSCVTLMTLHAAKGLEFPTVFLPGMEEGLFPHLRAAQDRAALEEERRLCYVGLTRAKQHLHLSAARLRSLYGRPQWTELSRFLREIPAELLDQDGLGEAESEADAESAAGSDHGRRVTWAREADAEATETGFAPGTRVLHATFGEGRVIASDGAGARRKLTIEFPVAGRKVIVARFVEPMQA